MSLERRLLKITPTGTMELYRGEPLHIGDVVISEMTLTREGMKWHRSLASSFVVVEDGIPSVAQGIEDDRT